jgi:hypothetical protein
MEMLKRFGNRCEAESFRVPWFPKFRNKKGEQRARLFSSSAKAS